MCFVLVFRITDFGRKVASYIPGLGKYPNVFDNFTHPYPLDSFKLTQVITINNSIPPIHTLFYQLDWTGLGLPGSTPKK